MMKALNITYKDLQVLFKGRGSVATIFILPILFVVVLPWAMSQSDEEVSITLPVAILEQDGAYSHVFINMLSQSEGFEVVDYQAAQAQRMLEDGEINHILTLPDDFSQSIDENQPTTLRLLIGVDASDEDTSAIQHLVEAVAKDMSIKAHLIASLELLGVMGSASPSQYQVFETERIVAQSESQFERSREQLLVDVKQTYPQEMRERAEISGTQVSVPGVTVLFVFLTSMTTAGSILQEKNAGSFRRLLAAPMSKLTLMLGKLLPNYMLTLVQVVVVFVVGLTLYPLIGLERLDLGNDLLALVVLSMIVALCSTSFGVLVAAIAHTENQLTISNVALWIMGVVGGSFFPTFLLGGFLGTVGKVVPHYWANKAFNDLLVRGKMLTDLSEPLLALIGFTLLFFAVGLWRFDFE